MIKHTPLSKLVLLMAVLVIPATLYSTPLPQSAADVKVSGSIVPDKTKKGRTVRANVVVEIPQGLHLQSNKPLDKFLIPTKLDVETPTGITAGAVSYPRAVLRSLKFSKNKVAVFEGRTSIRFPLTVQPNYAGGAVEIKGKLRFQACNDEACFPPVTKEVKMWVNVE
jgi:DsbC/DsbD-like thiol-disulfide interchange protein